MKKEFTLHEKIQFLLDYKTKLKTDKSFLEDLYNHNGIISTDKSRPINSAYKFRKELNLSIKRRDYSNTYDIKIMD